jgi:long-chain fatty acid transport protein
MVNITALAVAVLMGLAGSASAAGFRQANQSASANGMGTAFTAVANDASAVWYNPAAMTDLHGTNLSLGSVFVAPRTEHLSTTGITDRPEAKTSALPHVYATRRINDKFAVGLGVNVPYGLGTDWDKNNSLTRRVATKSELIALNANMNGSYAVSENLSVAAGASFVKLDATMNKAIWLGGSNYTQKSLEGDGTGVGYNAAALYKHNKWRFAANYRSQVKIDIDGTIHVDNAGLGVTNRDASTEITLPDTFQFGIAHQCTDKFLASIEADYTNWTTYRKLVIDYTNNANVAQRSTDYKYWNAVWAFRLGTEYKVSEAWKIRAGGYYDMTPIEDNYFETRSPGSDRIAFSVGAGWTKGNLSVDASYLYLKMMERKIDDSKQDDALAGGSTVLNGKYNTTARLPALTVNYKF